MSKIWKFDLKRMTILIGMGIFSFILACTPKAGETLATDTPKPETPAPTGPQNPDCLSLFDLSPADKDRAETAFVLYRDYLKVENWTEAKKYWMTAFFSAPGSNGMVKSHFTDGVRIYTHLMTLTSDETLKMRYVDTIRMIHAKRKVCFGHDATYLGQMAFDYYYNLNAYIPQKEIYETFKLAADASGPYMDYFILNPFAKVLFDEATAFNINLDEGRTYAKKILKSVEYGLANCKGSECEAWAIVNSYAPDRMEALESIDGFYDCEYYQERYYPIYQQNPDSCDVVREVYAKLLRGNCSPNMAQVQELKKLTETTCYVAPPSAGPCAEGMIAYNNGRYRESVNKFQLCADSHTDTEKKANTLLLIAKIYYRDLKDYPKSRKYALDAAKQKPKWGEPFMLIGKLYASSGPLCGPGTGFDSQVVTWPAIDKFNYAKSIDPSITSEANKLINTYQKYMPNREDLFQRSIQVGSPFTVGCWIQENTTVRSAD